MPWGRRAAWPYQWMCPFHLKDAEVMESEVGDGKQCLLEQNISSCHITPPAQWSEAVTKTRVQLVDSKFCYNVEFRLFVQSCFCCIPASESLTASMSSVCCLKKNKKKINKKKNKERTRNPSVLLCGIAFNTHTGLRSFDWLYFMD